MIFPYDPLIASQDRSHFGVLDVFCAFNVYKGNPDDALRHILIGNNADFSNVGAQRVYQTEAFPGLQGQCFAALDDVGMFHIFRGHPAYGKYQPVWSSNRDSNSDLYYSPYMSHHVLEVTDGGDAVVWSIVPSAGGFDPYGPGLGRPKRQCMWSSSSCDQRIASTIHAYRRLSAILARELQTLSVCISAVGEAASDLMNSVVGEQRIAAVRLFLARLLEGLGAMLDKSLSAGRAVAQGLLSRIGFESLRSRWTRGSASREQRSKQRRSEGRRRAYL